MRIGLALTLTFSLLLAGVVWYQKTAAICPAPLSYRIGAIDPKFGIDEAGVKKTLRDVEAVWESQTGRELFYYSEKGALEVSFVYDERQANSTAVIEEKKSLDEQQADIDALKEKLAILQKDYDEAAAAYTTARQEYESELQAYNQEVQRYNDSNGAPPAVFATLEATRIRLDREMTRLNATGENLSAQAATINELGEKANQLVLRYNEEATRFNFEHDHPEEFTQGDYQDGQIRIYEFSDQAELITVLVHEFGHALGIAHVEGEDSIMYYLLENPRVSPVLSKEDTTAFLAVCGTGDEFPHVVRRMVRSLLP
jgi:hypothetical protein